MVILHFIGIEISENDEKQIFINTNNRSFPENFFLGYLSIINHSILFDIWACLVISQT